MYKKASVIIIAFVFILFAHQKVNAAQLGTTTAYSVFVNGHDSVAVQSHMARDMGGYPTIFGYKVPDTGSGQQICSTNGSDPNNGLYDPGVGGNLYWCANQPFSGLTNGTYYISEYINGTDFYRASFVIDSHVCTDCADVTKIITTDPTASSTVSTSTPVSLGATFYVSPEDFDRGDIYLQLIFNNQTASLGLGSAIQAWDTAFGNVEMLIDSSGFGATSTSKDFSLFQGKTYGTYQIIVKSCSFFGIWCSSSVLTSTTTYFYIGQKTAFDRSQENGSLGIFGIGDSGCASPFCDNASSTISSTLLDCPLFSPDFDMNDCMWSFVVPNSALLSADIRTLETVPVVGWLPRILHIIIGTQASSSLPVLSYTFASNRGVFSGQTYHFNPWQYFYTDGAPVKDEFVSDSGGGNIWTIFEPIINILVYLTLLFVIIKRLSGMDYGSSTGSETESVSTSMTTNSNGKTYVSTNKKWVRSRNRTSPRLRS